jgi:hypothetical protein
MPFIAKCTCGYFFIHKHKRDVINLVSAHYRKFRKHKNDVFKKEKISIYRINGDKYQLLQELVKRAPKNFFKGMRGNLNPL